MNRWNSHPGFTLVELTTAISATAVIFLAFAVTMFMYRRETSQINALTSLNRDLEVVNSYIDKHLFTAYADSTRIYADSSTESSGNSSSSGAILRTCNANDDIIQIRHSGEDLVWSINSVQHTPVDNEISSLSFARSLLDGGLCIVVTAAITNGNDTLTFNRNLLLRN